MRLRRQGCYDPKRPDIGGEFGVGSLFTKVAV